MKKIVIGIAAVVVVPVLLAYGLLFTQPGNNLLKPIVESKINSALNTKMTLEKFSLRPSYILLKLKMPMGSTFVIDGAFSLFSKNVDVKYVLSVGKSENKFKQFKFKGPFWVKGTAKGSLEGNLAVNGKSNFADSDITYNIKLKNKKPSLVVAQMNKLRLSKLLFVLNKPAFANADIKIDIKLTSFKEGALKGKGNLYITNGTLNNMVIQKSFNINLPKKTIFNAKADIVLNGSFVDFQAKLNSSLGESGIKGSFSQKSNKINAKYVINLTRLALLKPITNMNLKGSFSTDGTLQVTTKGTNIDGTSNIADSESLYSVVLRKSKIENLKLILKHARLEKILAVMNKPVYAKGLVDVNVNMTDITPKKLTGKATVKISKGLVNSSVVKRLFKINMPKTPFRADIVSIIKNGIANSKIKVDSSIASLYTNKTGFNISKFVLNSDYTLKIPNLDKLYFVTNRHMRGSSLITGDVSYTKKGLSATAFSKMWGGNINIKLANNNVIGKAKGVSVVKIMDMMRYSRIFDSKGDIDFKYNLLTKKGNVNALFVNGHILPNRVTFLLHNMARFDVTKEIYKTTKIDSRIDNKKIYSNLDMVSRLTHITSKNAFIDLNRDFIDAKVRVAVKKSPVYVKLKGNLSRPRIKIDFRGMVKHKIEKKAKKKIKKLIKGFLK